MNDNNENWKTEDESDRALDAALAEYTSVEPRAGLEERILANLRAADSPTIARRWWNWRIAAVVAATLIIAVSLVARWNRASQPPTVVQRPHVKEAPIAPQVANRENSVASQKKLPRHRGVRTQPQQEIVAVDPKLDVFPSPLPLSEQEKILSLYVEKYPEHAALVAEARMDALRQQAEERRQIAGERDEKQ
jgi:hypothetical protein